MMSWVLSEYAWIMGTVMVGHIVVVDGVNSAQESRLIM